MTAVDPAMLVRQAFEGLVGNWSGEGEGSYPDTAPFVYIEETTITAAADWKMLRVVQQTWRRDRDGGRASGLHLEVGLVMVRDDGALLYNCAQGSGRVEVMIGGVSVSAERDIAIAWQTTAHANDPRLVRAGRTWWLGATTLRYESHLATVRAPSCRRHLEAMLTRTTSMG